ncbi:hypothetical protein BDZ85DRAFT_63347 [Elsinoe ampelina]|uniref:Fido domain-containing protein n=1 Tax=Elsinoe ampelina TaxID=302913 RepID=A0A6A6FZH9_9PEZI|nr:hypothetical protein BDZ85DRAFT_63347 [Elsinoe ampelina]
MSTPCSPFRFLRPNQVHILHKLLMGFSTPLSQPAMLSSACESPENLSHYTGEENHYQLASHLAEKLARNHPFQDGNKRTALFAADVFLRLHGKRLRVSNERAEDELADAQVRVVTGEWTGEELGKYYEEIASK